VAAIALVIALGTGSYAGLSSVTRWRRISTDDAYASLRMYDVRVRLADNAFVSAGQLEAAARSIPDASAIDGATERLAVEIQVDASTAERAILVPGLMYGVDVRNEGPPINALYAARGRGLTASDAGAPSVLLERNFANYYDLPPSGSIRIGGGHELTYVGQALTPEYFVVTTERGGIVAQSNFAAVFASLETVQSVTGHVGMVNDLLLTVRDGADASAVRQQVEAALGTTLPGVGTTTTETRDDPAFKLNDEDIDGDQQTYDIFAVLIFAGAVVAAFNLTTRMVEAQRREIGIAMVMGVQPARIAIRPMLVGAEIALLGVVFGLGVGYALGQTMMILVRDLQPLPAWHTPFQWRLFSQVAAIGFVLPLAATAWPVWRAIRVTPIEAIRPAYRSSRGGGLAPYLRWLRAPGGTFQQMPVRNVSRSPRRSLLTVLGIAASLAALVGFVGLIDSFVATTERGDREILGKAPDRLDVTLSGFLPENASQVSAIQGSPLIGESEAGARMGATIISGGKELMVQLDLVNLESDIWRPTLVEGARDRTTTGIYISELAASDLGVSVGGMITLRHPRLDPSGQVAFVDTEMPVLGIHPHPFRFVAYMDRNQYALFAPAPFVSTIAVIPRAGVSSDDVKRGLFEMDGVSSVQHVGDTAQAIRDLLDQFVVVLRVVEGAMLLIAFLIAFNSSTISMDERARDHATMFAFGVPVRRVLGIAMAENLIIGLFATALGILGGWALLDAIVQTRLPQTLPEIDIHATLGTSTIVLALVFGVLVVCLAPLLTWRRLARMDVPASLKIVE
jgi:putative ABC transport system permease protein